ncbi:hypothetical protein PUN28_020298 [Cardiocondyla obscurior]|uniref:Uncharacterized protein n=1 Tax=Cardiocondyla obscurior TaxID=286306 RepID=A0AAW2E7V8_9HYME
MIIFSILPSPEAEILTENDKKFFQNLATYYCAMTSADAHVTIFSVLPSPEAEILTKNEKRILQNLATYHCAVTSADAHVTIFSVLLSPEAEILTKTKKILKIWQRTLCGDVSRCPRDPFSAFYLHQKQRY